MPSRSSAVVGLCGIVPAVLPAAAAAQPGPNTPYAILVADTELDAIFLTRDWNGDGDADDAGEVTVYFDGTNASGLPAPREGVSLFGESSYRDRPRWFGDAASRAVYTLRDANNDGDALAAGEGAVWFSHAGNAGGLPLDRPVALAWDHREFLIIAHASAGGTDALYFTRDLNGDGDAEDAGEAAVYMDLAALLPGLRPTGLSHGWGGNSTTMLAVERAGVAEAIYRIKDEDWSGRIEPGEFNLWLARGNPFGAPVSGAIGAYASPYFHVAEAVDAPRPRGVWRLYDSDYNGRIDRPQEAVRVWDEGLLAPPFSLGAVGGLHMLGAQSGPHVAFTSRGGTPAQNGVVRLVQLDGDEYFTSPGETVVWASSGGPGAFPLAAGPVLVVDDCYADCDRSTGWGSLDIFDYLCFVRSYLEPSSYACDCDTSTGPGWCDVFDFLCWYNAFAAGCP